jgi:hypothetical protein
MFVQFAYSSVGELAVCQAQERWLALAGMPTEICQVSPTQDDQAQSWIKQAFSVPQRHSISFAFVGVAVVALSPNERLFHGHTPGERRAWQDNQVRPSLTVSYRMAMEDA